MIKEPQKPAPRHPGLCMARLDDENRAVVVELVALCEALSLLPLREHLLGSLVCLSCPACLARTSYGRSPAEAEALAKDFVHAAHCPTEHAKRLLSGDAALQVIAQRELGSPGTTYGRARHVWIHAEDVAAEDTTS
ncbi:MAG TPA: hypothetical protein PKI03_07830 [Pseudomonadota bacterium]|nr:hypothetical protein [Pseudomonadota bacterium]